MRLKTIEQRSRHQSVSGVGQILYYRPEIFGLPFSIYIQDVLRGPSEWSVGERELFAAFVSHKNQCVY
jgi:hypothetical protein